MKFSYPDIDDIRHPEADVRENVKGSDSIEPDKPTAADEYQEADETRGFWERFSMTVSWVFVPLLMPFYGIMLILFLSVLDFVSPGTKLVVSLVILGLNTALPMILVYLLKILGVVEDIGLNGQKERLWPYLITLAGYILSTLYLMNRGAPEWVWLLFAGGGLTAVINMAINFRWKISAHSAAAAGVVAMLAIIAIKGDPVVEMMPRIFIAMTLTGILGSCRLYLHRHTLMQVLCGYTVGFLAVFLPAYLL